MRFLKGLRLQKIAGADLFYYEMDRLNKMGGNCFFLGSSNETLEKIKKRVSKDYSDVKVYYHSPPYKSEFDEVDNKIMIEKINAVEPDVLFIGMTAPKQEKWAYSHFNKLKAGHVCSVGAVFDFYAGTVNRSPNFMIYIGLEWLYRLIKEPRRMWRRYLLGNTKFIGYILKEKFVSFK